MKAVTKRLWIQALVAAALQAQGVPPPGRISGRVLTPEGTPIARATVFASGGGVVYQEDTAGDGSFTIAAPAGNYSTWAAKFGYRSIEIPGRQEVMIASADEGTDLVFRLGQLGVVSGVVVDADGDPVPQMKVELRHVYFNGQEAKLLSGYFAITDDRGEFRILEIPYGRYYLRYGRDVEVFIGDRAGPQLRQIRGASARQQDRRAYYPGVEQWSAAEMLDVGPTPMEGLRLQMPRGPAFHITAHAEGTPAGEILPNVLIFSQDGELMNPENDESALPPGRYVLMARAGNYRSPSMIGIKEVTITDRDLEDVGVPLLPTRSVSGRITYPGGVVPGRIPVRLVSLDAPEIYANAPAMVADDGTFRVDALAAGRYRALFDFGRESFYIGAIHWGGRELATNEFELGTDEEASLEIELADPTGRLYLPEDGDYTIWPVESMPAIPVFARGHASVDLRPGAYRVIRWAEPPLGTLILDGGFLRTLADAAISATITVGATTTLRIEETPREVVHAAMQDYVR